MDVDKFMVFSSDMDDSRYLLTNKPSNFMTSLPFQRLELTNGSRLRITSVEYPKNWKYQNNDQPNDGRFIVVMNLFDMMPEPIGYACNIKQYEVAPFSFMPNASTDKGGLYIETKLYTEWHQTRPMRVDKVHVRIIDTKGRDIVFGLGNTTVTIEIQEMETGEFPVTYGIPSRVTR